MTAAFDCPKCGAPLSFEPNPGDETVECPYCHEIVIIPEELRIPLSQVVAQPPPPPKQSKRRNWVIIAVACDIVVTVFIANIINNLFHIWRYQWIRRGSFLT